MIGTILELMLNSGTSVKRWNKFPKTEDLSYFVSIVFFTNMRCGISKKNFSNISYYLI